MFQQTLKIKNRVYQEKRKTGEQEPRFGKPCSKKQAQALKQALGFKKTLKWLQATFTVEQAGYLLRQDWVRKGQTFRKRWQVRIPARHLLGFARSDIALLKQELSQLIEKYHDLNEKKESP